MRVLISHSSRDSVLINVIQEILEKSSLNKLEVWHTSDRSDHGGYSVGDGWFERILEKLNEADIVISVITPNSINSPWLYYESGFGEARHDTKVVPVVFGYEIDEVGPPLNKYQIHNIANSESFRSFFRKMLSFAGIKFVDDVHSSLFEKYFLAIKEVERASYASPKKVDAGEILQALDVMALRIETKIGNVISKFPSSPKYSSFLTLKIPVYREGSDNVMKKIIVSMNSNWSLGRLLDECYYSISDLVEPYCYLETWVIRERYSKAYLVALGAALRAPAEVFLEHKSNYEILLLNNKYDPTLDENAYPYQHSGIR